MKHLLGNRGFQAFLWTQFLGALNDNLYKTVVSLHAVRIAAEGGSGYLAMAGAVFVIPFLLFSGYSGYLADRFSKRTVMISVKAFEIAVMGLGLVAFVSTSIPLMLAVLFLMALHSTLFSPAKYGLVPETLPERDLSPANGLLEMTTFVAIVLGTSLSSFLYPVWHDAPWKLGLMMIGIAVGGFAISFHISRVPAAGAAGPFRFNPLAEVIDGTRRLLEDRPLWLTVTGISYFWMLGALFQMDLLLYGAEILRVDDARIGLMVTALAVGIGAGSVLAGKLSGDRVELGLVPLGSIFMGISCLTLYSARGSYPGSVVALSALGLASGLFIVPLNAFLQQRGESGEKGRIIATNNFYNTVGLLIASGVLWLTHDRLHFGADGLILGAGIVTIGATVYTLRLMPEYFVRFLLRCGLAIFYRFRVVGVENVPKSGPALLVSNHVSYMDGFLVAYAAFHRRVRFMIWRPYYQHWALGWFFRYVHAIPVDTNGPRGVVASLKAAREQLEAGHVVCIYAEGSITRTGNLLPFKRGMEKIVEGLDVPVIPVHLDRIWGSIFSFRGGRFFGKPWRIPHPVTVSFGSPLPKGATARDAHQAVMELSADAVPLRKEAGDTLPARFIRSARRNWKRFAMVDATGREMTHGRALTAAVMLADLLARRCQDQTMIGLLLPSSIGGALANLGVALTGKIPVNLNFTAGKEGMAYALAQCRIRTVITSKIFLAKAKVEAPEGVVYLEDLLKQARGSARALAWIKARLLPVSALAPATHPDTLATVIFSSGSTGVPKGVMLSHYNVIANIESMLDVYPLTEDDRIVGVLPLFHSFGFTVTLWLPFVKGCGAIYHHNPIEGKAIGELIQKHRGTLLLSTPTFCGMYVRKCTREQFAPLRYVLVGAEKLREPLRLEFRDVFGLEMFEGYGCTEMSPAIAVNAPGYEAGRESQVGHKPGTVGQPLPGIAVRIVDIETRKPLPYGEQGLLLVKGANRMLGYLNQPERTTEALQGGWYITGDIAAVDEDGFLRITDRLSRFSKIGGEMVPHVKIEEAVSAATGGEPCAVAGIPDERKGELIAVLYTAARITPEELWKRLSETDLPKLWIPKRENIQRVDALPMLGTGKLDLRRVREMAMSMGHTVLSPVNGGR